MLCFLCTYPYTRCDWVPTLPWVTCKDSPFPFVDPACPVHAARGTRLPTSRGLRVPPRWRLWPAVARPALAVEKVQSLSNSSLPGLRGAHVVESRPACQKCDFLSRDERTSDFVVPLSESPRTSLL